MRMLFGKYKGCDLRDIPDGYLVWVLDNANCLGPTLRDAIERELDRRESPPAPPPQPQLDQAALKDVIARWFRRLVLRHHPDRGGSRDVMAAITDAKEELRTMLTDAGLADWN